MESDEDSQASQDSMIVHEVQDAGSAGAEIHNSQQRPSEPKQVTTEFQADWVPPWRIKAGRVPASQAKNTHSEESLNKPASTESEVPSFSQPQPLAGESYSDFSSDKMEDSMITHSSFKVEATPESTQKEESDKIASVNQPWMKRFGSKEDLLKPHAPIPWKSDNNQTSQENRNWHGGPGSHTPTEDEQKGTGLSGRKSPSAESSSSMNSAEERLEAEIMDRLEQEAQEEEAAERRHLDTITDEMNDSKSVGSSNANSFSFEQVLTSAPTSLVLYVRKMVYEPRTS